MGTSRMGLGANLTPSEAREKLAVPVLHVLLGLATPLFEQTGVTRPSGLVSIRPTGPGAHQTGYPEFPGVETLNAKQWQKAVVPVLVDPRWDVTTPINRSRQPAELVRLLGLALEGSFQAAGYGLR